MNNRVGNTRHVSPLLISAWRFTLVIGYRVERGARNRMGVHRFRLFGFCLFRGGKHQPIRTNQSQVLEVSPIGSVVRPVEVHRPAGRGDVLPSLAGSCQSSLLALPYLILVCSDHLLQGLISCCSPTIAQQSSICWSFRQLHVLNLISLATASGVVSRADRKRSDEEPRSETRPSENIHITVYTAFCMVQQQVSGWAALTSTCGNAHYPDTPPFWERGGLVEGTGIANTQPKAETPSTPSCHCDLHRDHTHLVVHEKLSNNARPVQSDRSCFLPSIDLLNWSHGTIHSL